MPLTVVVPVVVPALVMLPVLAMVGALSVTTETPVLFSAMFVTVLAILVFAAKPGMWNLAKQMFAASVSPSLEQFLGMELLVGPQLSQTDDHAEGRTAFGEKRKPRFTGR